MRHTALVSLGAVLLVSGLAQAQSGNLAVNPGFEQPLSVGWPSMWEREPGATTATQSTDAHSGSYSLQVTHTGEQDWCVTQDTLLTVAGGDIFELSGWIKCSSVTGEVNYSVVTRDAGGNAIDWVFGPAGSSGTHDWQPVLTHFVTPDSCATIQLRVVGWGPGAAWFDDVSLVKEGNVIDIRGPAEDIAIGNSLVSVVFHTGSATFTCTDLRNGRVYQQLATSGLPVVLHAEPHPEAHAITATLWEPASDLKLQLRLDVAPSAAEFRCELSATGAVARDFPYPAPFSAPDGSFMVVPMNEGIIYPADDETVEPLWLVGYSGHGISMPWFGQCQGTQGPGLMAIIEDPDDMHIVMDRPSADGNANLSMRPVWEPSRGAFGYSRALTYVFLESGGYVSQAKRYRQWAQDTGLYRSLLEKRDLNQNVDLLIGAVNVWAPSWYGNTDPVGLAKEMQALGIHRMLWSEGTSPENVVALNAMPGVLTSRYDIYQDVWPPDAPTWANHEGWPEDLVLLPDSSIMQGWVIRDGETLYPGGVICSPRGLEHAQLHIPEDLATTPYRCRFLDTTTASNWKECYHPDHPTTRSQDRYYKMELLRFCLEDMNLVTGSETGIDPSVPYVHYYEGMMSLGPYRLPDCGYTLIDYKPPTPEFLKYQVGPHYRVPLWELVYHDCTVAYWYWGDSSNKAPEVWNQRDLFNLLYGNPPLFMLSPEVWTAHKGRFLQSYRDVSPTVRRIGYDEMVSHEFLTDDHTLQRTAFSSGVSVVANFADHTQSLPAGQLVPALGVLVTGPPTEARTTTTGLYDAAASNFRLRNSNAAGSADVTFRFGPAPCSWIPLAGDWDGDGDDTAGLYDPALSTFRLANRNADSASSDAKFRFGPSPCNWLPITGDWDGDGDETAGLYDPATGTFRLRNSNTAGVSDLKFRFGPAPCIWLPIAGDWNGDGVDTVGLYDPATSTFRLRNSNTAGISDIKFKFGPSPCTWLPIAGDWNGDGTDTVGLYDAATDIFRLINHNAAAAVADVKFVLGPISGIQQPIAGDWDGM
jgi:hypothetical protein